MVSASELSGEPSSLLKSLREVGGSVQNGHGSQRGRVHPPVVRLLPLSPVEREHRSRRQTDSRNEVTNRVALLGGRYQQQGARPHAPGWEDGQRSKRLWESQGIG